MDAQPPLPPATKSRTGEATGPLVSVCVTTCDGARFVAEAIDSALAQTYEPLEIVIADDASTDGTTQILRSYEDPRIRLVVNRFRRGEVANRNYAISLTRGELVKFLDQDDTLSPECVAENAALFAAHPALGFAFSRRRILIEEGDVTSTAGWDQMYANLHERFAELASVNDGLQLVAEWLRGRTRNNWFGEPVTVMARRDHLQRVGGFNPSVRQMVDMDLWLRLAAQAPVGFIDRQLVGYRHGHVAESTGTRRRRNGWLDRLWTLEALALEPEICRALPDLRPQLARERRAAHRTCVKLGRSRGGAVPIRPYFEYAFWRARRAIGFHASIRGDVAPPGA